MLKKVGEDNVYIIDLCTYKYNSKRNGNCRSKNQQTWNLEKVICHIIQLKIWN